MKRRDFLLNGLGLAAISPIVLTLKPEKSARQEKLEWIFKNYSELDNEDKQEVLGLILNKVGERKINGEPEQARSLANLAIYLVQTYGGFA